MAASRFSSDVLQLFCGPISQEEDRRQKGPLRLQGSRESDTLIFIWPGVCFSKFPAIGGNVKLLCFRLIPDGSFKRFQICRVKLSAQKTKWTLLGVTTHPTFLETFSSKYDFGPIKSAGLSGNRPQKRFKGWLCSWKMDVPPRLSLQRRTFAIRAKNRSKVY